MTCEICKKQTRGRLCKTCRNFLQWMYSDKDPEDVLDLYKEEYVKNSYTRRRKKS